MSRVGRKPIVIPDGVEVSVNGRAVSVQGPGGALSWTPRPEVSVKLDEQSRTLTVDVRRKDRICRSLHGMSRSLIANMVEGCHKGFSKELEVHGVGYGAQMQGKTLSVTCGFSHPVLFEVPDGLTVEVKTPQARGTNPAVFLIRGADKQAVGEFAARIRKVRPPEPYKGKGIRYAGEQVRRKVGKAFAGGAM